MSKVKITDKFIMEERYRCATSLPYYASSYGRLKVMDASRMSSYAPVETTGNHEWYRQMLYIQDTCPHNQVTRKSRQRGFTWASALGAVKTAAFEQGHNIFFMSKRERDAKEIINRCAFILRQNFIHEPWLLREEGIEIGREWIRFKDTDCHIEAMPHGEDIGAGFSFTKLYSDEAALQKYLRQNFPVIMPALMHGGQGFFFSSVRFGSYHEELANGARHPEAPLWPAERWYPGCGRPFDPTDYQWEFLMDRIGWDGSKHTSKDWPVGPNGWLLMEPTYRVDPSCNETWATELFRNWNSDIAMWLREMELDARASDIAYFDARALDRAWQRGNARRNEILATARMRDKLGRFIGNVSQAPYKAGEFYGIGLDPSSGRGGDQTGLVIAEASTCTEIFVTRKLMTPQERMEFLRHEIRIIKQCGANCQFVFERNSGGEADLVLIEAMYPDLKPYGYRHKTQERTANGRFQAESKGVLGYPRSTNKQKLYGRVEDFVNQDDMVIIFEETLREMRDIVYYNEEETQMGKPEGRNASDDITDGWTYAGVAIHKHVRSQREHEHMGYDSDGAMMVGLQVEQDNIGGVIVPRQKRQGIKGYY